MSKSDIAGVVDFYTRKNTGRSAFVQASTRNPLGMGRLALAAGGSGGRVTMPAGGAGAAAGGGGSRSGYSRAGAGQALDQLWQGLNLPGDSAPGRDMALDMLEYNIDQAEGGNKIAQAGLRLGQDLAAQDPTGTEKPQNPTQWILNLLGTGSYQIGHIAHGLGKVTAERSRPEANTDNSPGGNFAHNMGTLGQQAAAVVGGAARGTAEGFGARFDGERPRTLGRSLEEIGGSEAIRQGVQGAGGDERTQNFWAGLAGFGLDVVFDPINLIPGGLIARGGLGATKTVRGGAAGAGDALRSGRNAVGGFVRGARAGQAKHRTDMLQLAADRAQARQIRAEQKGKQGGALADRRAADNAAREAQPKLVDETIDMQAPAGAAPAAARQADEPVNALDDAIATVDAPATTRFPDDAPVGAAAPDPRLAAIDTLLPGLRQADTPPLADPAQVLAHAQTTSPAMISETLASDLRTVLRRPDDLSELMPAIRATDEGKAFLARPLVVGGKKTTVGDMIIGSAQRGTGTAEGAMLRRSIEKAIESASTPRTRGLTADGLRGVLDDVGVVAENGIDDLVERLIPATPEQRLEILGEVLGGEPGAGFNSFDDAMAAAIDGQLDSSAMRSMLKALGVRSNAKSPAGLQKALTTKGKLEWEKLRDSIPTEKEIRGDFGISDDVADAAAKADVEDIRNTASNDMEEALAALDDLDAGADFEAGTVATSLPSPKVGGNVRSQAILQAMDEAFDGITPALLPEKAGFRAWVAAHSAATRAMGKMLNTRRAGNGKVGLTGAQRADRAYPAYMEAIGAAEAYAKSRGVMPYLKLGRESQPLYLSFGDILGGLSPDVVKRSLFDLNYRQTKFGKGQTPKGAEKQKAGLTVLPTTFANGVERALDGGTADEILAHMTKLAKHGNAFEKTKAGQAALRDIAEDMARPQFVDEMRLLHEGQEVAALAFMFKAADEVVAPIANRFIAAVGRNADRSQVLSSLRAAVDSMATIRPGADRSFVKELAQQRIDNGILNALGETGVAMVRRDRQVAGGGSEAAQLKRNLTPPKQTPAERTAAHGERARAQRDFEDSIYDKLDEEAVLEEVDLADIPTYQSVMSELGGFQLFAKLNVAARASAGMFDLRPIMTSVTEWGSRQADRFVADLRTTVFGGRQGPGMSGVAQPRLAANEGWMNRLSQDMGGQLTDVEFNAAVSRWWGALGRSTAHLEATLGRTASPEELHALLRQGGPAQPLTEAQADMAMQLHQMIESVFAPVDGPFARSGIDVADLNKDLARYGFASRDNWDTFMLDESLALKDQPNIWRSFDSTIMDAPLDVLANYRKALERSQMRVSLADTLSRTLDHRTLEPGKSIDQLKAAGWRKIDTQSEASTFAKYIDPDAYFPPDKNIPQQLAYLENFFEKAAMDPGVLRLPLQAYDFVTRTLKSALTLWRPAHHAVSLLGDTGVLVLAGANPMYMMRSIRAMRAGGKLPGDVDGVLKRSGTEMVGAGGARSDGTTAQQWFGETAGGVRIPTKDGQITSLDAGQVWQLADKAGVQSTPMNAADYNILGGPASVLGSRLERSFRRRNPIGRVNEKLGELSASRDNLTRMAHFMHALENGGPFRNLDEATAYAAKRVHEYHPTIANLSRFEQNVMRRVNYFYTWVRVAMGFVLRTAMDRPAIMTVPSKWQYNQATAAGFEPESLGDPHSDDEDRTASYLSGSALGPTFESGYSPFETEGTELMPGEEPHRWGVTLSSPQIDALEALFSGLTEADGNVFEMVGDQLNPLIKNPIEFMTHSRIGGSGGDPTEDPAGHLFQQTGLPFALSRATGLNPKYDEGDATGVELLDIQRQNQGEQERSLFNLLSGLGATDYTSNTSASVANRDRRAYMREEMAKEGYSKKEIDAILKEILG